MLVGFAEVFQNELMTIFLLLATSICFDICFLFTLV